MACPQCVLRLPAPSRTLLAARSPRRAGFHTSSPRQRLGAATYRQEWQMGAYHYNKETTKNHPVAAQTVNRLLEQYVTMRQDSDAPPAVKRANIATRRKGMDNFFVSHTTAKDFGDRVVVDAVVYDAASALQKEKDEKFAQRKARPAGRPGAAGGGAGAGAGAGGQRRPPFGSRMRAPGVRGAGAAGGAAGGAGGGVAFRSVFRAGVPGAPRPAGPGVSRLAGLNGPRSSGLSAPRTGGLNGPRPSGLGSPRSGGITGSRPGGLGGSRGGPSGGPSGGERRSSGPPSTS